jgi:hypothetical protein
MMESVETWISAVSSLTLVGVTAWYAILTHRLAVSARKSAASAERTVQIAADALAASVAGLDVVFDVNPNFHAGSAVGVSVTCCGATVFVHGARMDGLWALDGILRRDGYSSTQIASAHDLVFDDSDVLNSDGLMLPARLHRNETIHFKAEPQVDMDLDKIAQLDVTIWYSLSLNGAVEMRRAAYDLNG